jgi:phospholipid N-methyltransferase
VKQRLISQFSLCTGDYLDMLSKTNASSSQPATVVQQSPLLNLPAEIRNRIFEYALSTPSGKLNLNATSSDKRINQLQDVSLQVRHETQLLEFKLNPIVQIAGEVKSLPSGRVIERTRDPDKALQVFTGFAGE